MHTRNILTGIIWAFLGHHRGHLSGIPNFLHKSTEKLNTKKSRNPVIQGGLSPSEACLSWSYFNEDHASVTEICTGRILTVSARPLTSRPGIRDGIRGPELSSGPSPFRPVACPSPASRNIPARQKQFSRAFLYRLFNTVMHFIKQWLI